MDIFLPGKCGSRERWQWREQTPGSGACRLVEAALGTFRQRGGGRLPLDCTNVATFVLPLLWEVETGIYFSSFLFACCT